MFYIYVEHQVRDFDYWKNAFDAHADVRAQNGETSHKIFQDTDDQNKVSGLFGWESLEKGQKFFTSPELKSAMQEAGVVSEPVIKYFQSA